MEKEEFILREIAILKELLDSKITAIEKSINVAHEDMVRVPTEVQKQVGNLKELIFSRIEKEHELKEVKFAKVDQRFELIESARIEQKEDLNRSITAALAAQERATAKQNESFLLSINKSESSTTKQIDSLYDRINDIKDRLTLIEGQSSGKKDFWGYIVGAIGLIAVLVSIFLAFHKP